MSATTGQPHVVALCGSLRDESTTRIALQAVLSASTSAGATTELVDLRSYDLPPLNAVDGTVEDANRLRTRIAAADSIVLGTPNYHGSFSGALKNALDYCDRDAFEGKTVGLLEVAAGEFPGSALMHLRIVCRTLQGWALPTEIGIPNSHSIITENGIDDPELSARARQLGEELVRYAAAPTYPESITESTDPDMGTLAER